MTKSFLVLFFKKELLAALTRLPCETAPYNFARNPMRE
jgi:hypothetical protein